MLPGDMEKRVAIGYNRRRLPRQGCGVLTAAFQGTPCNPRDACSPACVSVKTMKECWLQGEATWQFSEARAGGEVITEACL